MPFSYLLNNSGKYYPKQRDLAKSVDPVVLLNEAARILDCDVNDYRH